MTLNFHINHNLTWKLKIIFQISVAQPLNQKRDQKQIGERYDRIKQTRQSRV